MIRNILVTVFWDMKLPIDKDSLLDVKLLRTAHRALIRKIDGIIDTFLFVICSNTPQEDVIRSITSYGFPNVNCIFIANDEDGDDEQDYDQLRELIGYELSHWIKNKHPTAITSLSAGIGYDIDLWWSGIEFAGDEYSWQINTDKFASNLPDTHEKKASTWLAILTNMFYSENSDNWFEANKIAIYAATLCEWLHGFEAASGNSCNCFAAGSVCDDLAISDLYLGYILGKSDTCDTLEAICEGWGEERDEEWKIKAEALKCLTSELRSIVRNELSKFFGSDTCLFWTLYTAIWPKYDMPSVEACNIVVGCVGDIIAEVVNAWEFVTYGWSDYAD
ncbi:MAG: hypothetical protein WCR46_02400 [Deltaproteobacteria bacterium]